jgi:hypothetical protein
MRAARRDEMRSDAVAFGRGLRDLARGRRGSDAIVASEVLAETLLVVRAFLTSGD